MAQTKSPSISRALGSRMSARIQEMGDDQLHSYLAEAVYLERKRLSTSKDDTTEDERTMVEAAARAAHEGRKEMSEALKAMNKAYAHEIHNHFSSRTYGMATKLLPGALTRLLTAPGPRDGAVADFDPGSRIAVHGPMDQIRSLAENHTLVLAPTHVSNLDSPVIGYALYQERLPPFIYGAGLNLFNNTAMSFFMSRLGAYTVDRRKRHRAYKDTLKDYSTERIARGSHSLFFPGGTRCRSGRIESHLKRGLLGTAIQAWQEGLAANRPHPEILVVPCTLSFSLVLEAETLIEDSLSEQGKSRYIISDDEFSEPTTVYQFAKNVLNMDASVHVRFGAPLDLLGNPVDEQGHSLHTSSQVFDRRAYVTDRSGKVVWDRQRDQVYTNYLARALTRVYQQDSTVLPTHIVARAAWDCLTARYPRLDTYQQVLLAPFERWVDREALLTRLREWLDHIDHLATEGTIHHALPEGAGHKRAETLLQIAVDHFSRYHSRRAVAHEDWRILVDPKLALYYGNRLSGISAPRAGQ